MPAAGARAVSRLAGRVAVVTGAGRGIGAATALLFAAEGAAVVGNDLDAEPLEEVVAAITAAGGTAVAVVGDAGDPQVAGAIATAAADDLGALDILISNAGTSREGPFATQGADVWEAVHRSLLGTAVTTTRACLQRMLEAAGAELAATGSVAHQRKIVLTAAASTRTGKPGQSALAAAGGGVLGLTRTLAREVGGYGITVNAVVPGFVETRLTAPEPADAPETGAFGVAEPIRQMTRAMTALGRFGQPEDVARVHLFLASADADFVSGAAIPVTGGLLGTLA